MGLRRQRITHADALEFLESIKELPIRLANPVSYDGVFGLADRYGLTFYDAAYLDLAIRESLPLASLDDALCQERRSIPTWGYSGPNLGSRDQCGIALNAG